MRGRRPLRQLLAVIGLLVVGLTFIFPLYVLVATSLKPKAELFLGEPTIVPQSPTLAAFEELAGVGAVKGEPVLA